MKTSKRILSSLILLFTLLNASCGSAERPFEPAKGMTKPTLNEVTTIELQKRSDGTDDNYAQACLYLTQVLKKTNSCAILHQNDGSLSADLVGGDVAEFIKMVGSSDLQTINMKTAVSVGDSIDQEELNAGDVWILKKRNTEHSFDLVFKIDKVSDSAITLTYKVTRFDPIIEE